MTQNLLDEAVKSPPNERVRLAELLLESIDYTNDEITQSWLLEVKNRMQSVKNGQTQLLNFNDVC